MESKPEDSLKYQEFNGNSYGKTEVVDSCFIELALVAASCVGRILDNMKIYLGTGFMISDRLFMTNNHVISNSNKAMNCFVEFNYELDANNIPKAVTRFEFAPNDFFISSPEDDLDFTIVALGNRVFGEGKISDFGYYPLFEKNQAVKYDRANIIHHPQGKFKQIIVCQNQIVAWNNDVIQYYAKTEIGSSGAPVFNNNWELIAMHHWASPTRRVLSPKGDFGPRDTKEGILISAIKKRVNSEKKFLEPKQRALIDSSLNYAFENHN